MLLVHKFSKEHIRIIKNNKYDFLNLIFVFAKINPVKNIETGKKQPPIYEKYSKNIGFIFNFLLKMLCKKTEQHSINRKIKSTKNICCI